MDHQILVADYHRNGVGGAGFYVAIVKSDGEQYLCIDFAGDKENRDFDPGRFAVLRLDLLRSGNIGMHSIVDPDSGAVIEGQGGNAWRGADHWGCDLRKPIRDWVHRSYDAKLVRTVKAD